MNLFVWIVKRPMKKPEIPGDEAQRLASLRSLEILDTDPEARFDRLTRLARSAFGVPIALVSLVDENRQWFKSKAGLEASETPRDVSFCGHAILGDDIFEVEDATRDSRFSDNPLVTGEPNVCFYAGVPLRFFDGTKLGTLCIIDHEPRQLSDQDKRMLCDLAEMAEAELCAVRMATVDELTGLANRRGFDSLAQNSLNLCARQGVPVSMVFFDLNGFKLINDSFGHAEGDRALIAFANLMRKSFRDSDVIARIGGDEFVVLLTDATETFVADIVKRFREAVADFNSENKCGYDLCFSDGIVSSNPDQDDTIDLLLDQADSLMYENKTNFKLTSSEVLKEA